MMSVGWWCCFFDDDEVSTVRYSSLFVGSVRGVYGSGVGVFCSVEFTPAGWGDLMGHPQLLRRSVHFPLLSAIKKGPGCSAGKQNPPRAKSK